MYFAQVHFLLSFRDKRIREIQTDLDFARSHRASVASDAHNANNGSSIRSSPTPSLGNLSINGSVSEHFSMNPWPVRNYEKEC